MVINPYLFGEYTPGEECIKAATGEMALYHFPLISLVAALIFASPCAPHLEGFSAAFKWMVGLVAPSPSTDRFSSQQGAVALTWNWTGLARVDLSAGL